MLDVLSWRTWSPRQPPDGKCRLETSNMRTSFVVVCCGREGPSWLTVTSLSLLRVVGAVRCSTYYCPLLEPIRLAVCGPAWCYDPLYFRYNLCVWTDWNRKNVDNGRSVAFSQDIVIQNFWNIFPFTIWRSLSAWEVTNIRFSLPVWILCF